MLTYFIQHKTIKKEKEKKKTNKVKKRLNISAYPPKFYESPD